MGKKNKQKRKVEVIECPDDSLFLPQPKDKRVRREKVFFFVFVYTTHVHYVMICMLWIHGTIVMSFCDDFFAMMFCLCLSSFSSSFSC